MHHGGVRGNNGTERAEFASGAAADIATNNNVTEHAARGAYPDLETTLT